MEKTLKDLVTKKEKVILDKTRLSTAIKDCEYDMATSALAGLSIFKNLYTQGFKTVGQVAEYLLGGKEWLQEQKRQARRKNKK